MRRSSVSARQSRRSRKISLAPARKRSLPMASSNKVKQSYSARLPMHSTARSRHSSNRKKSQQPPSLKTEPTSCDPTHIATICFRQSLAKLRPWNLRSIKSPYSDEHRYYYRPRSSRTDLRCIRFEYLLALHSDAPTVARAGWRLHQGPFPEPLPSRCRRIPNRRGIAPAYRTLRPSRLASARSRHCEHRPRSHLDGPQRPANGQRHIDLVGLSCLAIPRRVRGHRARLIRLMAAQSDNTTPQIVVRGDAENFEQEITAGKHRLVADEPVSAGGGDAGPDPYDYLLASLGVCTSMTVGLYARRQKFPLEKVKVSLWHSRIYAIDCEECETKEGMLDRIDVEIELTGSVNEAQRAKLMEIAAKCPVHRTLTSEINIRMRAAPIISAS